MQKVNYSEEFLSQQREAKTIRKDISAARAIIADSIARYKKKMLHARSKKQAEDLSVFAELDSYSSMRDIQDAYGYDCISEKEMDRLNDLWEARERFINEQGRFEDRVSNMLTRAMNSIGEEFLEVLSDYDNMIRKDKEQRAQITRENSMNDYNRYIEGLFPSQGK